MEIFLLIVVVLIALVIIGKLKGESDNPKYVEQVVSSGLTNNEQFKDVGSYANGVALQTDGVTDAQRSLGELHYNLGMGFYHRSPPDYSEAAKWYRLAAEQGIAEAQFNIGVMYDQGRGIPQDYKEAAKWYRLAAEQGYISAQHNLGVAYSIGKGVPEDRILACMWLYIAATVSDSEKQRIHFIETQDLVTKKMTANQIAKAQELARKRIANNFKEC